MEIGYLILVIVLLGLACVDLIVGVSNDASNFLTSAVGAKSGTFRQILIVAAIGVLIGSLSAGGMMEIARKGVFNPSLFSFHDIIFIYIVVMLADIFLLDTFNTLKLPTSTTIAIVFNLLGASITTSLIKVYDQGKGFSDWGQYINTTKAIEMVAAIFVSVVVGFIIGWIVQSLMRLWVSFNYKRNMKLAGSVFGGLSIVVVLNFIVKVGFKESALRDAAFVNSINEYFLLIAVITFAVVAVIFYLLSQRKEFDTFKVVTLIGTFALAMAFASNDLINFVGVPLSSLEAYQLWKSSGMGPDDYMMTAFAEEGGSANILLLLLAGLIMIVTMFKSKKTRDVIETAVNLSKQQDGVEKYEGDTVTRNVVGFITFLAKGFTDILPKGTKAQINRQFTPLPIDDNLPDESIPAFDFVRSSINLIVAASLVSLGTSLKLPLSTTYVAFMVLMGTSLADRAWNRDSAVYRVAGVFTVIGGWFITALAALIISSIFVLICIKLQFIGVAIVIAIVVFAVYKLNQYHKEMPSPVRISLDWSDEIFKSMDKVSLKKQLNQRLAESLAGFGRYASSLVSAIIHEDKELARELNTQVNYLVNVNKANRSELSVRIAKMKPEQKELAKELIEYYVKEDAVLQQMTIINDISRIHILNMHRPLGKVQVKLLEEAEFSTQDAIQELLDNLSRKKLTKAPSAMLENSVSNALTVQVEGIIEDDFNYKNSNLFVSTIVAFRNIMNQFGLMTKQVV